tara:strand:+ start:848 stop:1369 length:522 start_codon:yes stop_codon:yes gene_type:complete
MPFTFRGDGEDPDAREKREREQQVKETRDYFDRHSFDTQGLLDQYNAAFDERLPGQVPDFPDMDNPNIGLPVGNMPMPRWMAPPDVMPGIPNPGPINGIPREIMEPENLPTQRFLEPEGGFPNPNPSGPGQPIPNPVGPDFSDPWRNSPPLPHAVWPGPLGPPPGQNPFRPRQ